MRAQLSKSVTVLNLSMRASNCLEAAQIHTIRELVGKSEADLLRFRSFGKTSLNMTLHGNTDDSVDQSIDSLKSVMIHLLEQFGAGNTLNLKVKKRGYAPLGGGTVEIH